MKKVVEVINLSKVFKKRIEKKLWFSNKYEKVTALNNISFSVNKGESIAIIGKNGSGKSTLLKILSGVYNQTSGIVKVNESINGILDSSIGFHKDLSGYDNILVQGKILGIPIKKIKNNIDEIVEFAEIKDYLYTPLKHYSNGMIARLTFSVVTLSEAEILLFDEVLAFGDIHFQQKAMQYIKTLTLKGKTIFITSHHLIGLVPVCNRFILLDKGHIISDGTPAEVLSKYYEQAYSSLQQQYNTHNTTNECLELKELKILSTNFYFQNEFIVFETKLNTANISLNNFDVGIVIRDFNGHSLTTFSIKKDHIEIPQNVNTIRFLMPQQFININFIMAYPFIVDVNTNEYKISHLPLIININKTTSSSELKNIYSLLGLINIPIKIEFS